MAGPKTRETTASVKTFLDAIEDEQRRQDCYAIVKRFEAATKAPARMWGTTIVGCGTYNRTYANGTTEEWMLVAFAPRKDRITLYIAPGSARHDALLAKLGKYKAGKGCIHIKRLEDIDLPALDALVKDSIEHLRERYP